MNNKYQTTLNEINFAIETIEHSILLSYEDDECTECYVQGLEECLEAMSHVREVILFAYKDAEIENTLSKVIVVPEGQLRLL